MDTEVLHQAEEPTAAPPEPEEGRAGQEPETETATEEQATEGAGGEPAEAERKRKAEEFYNKRQAERQAKQAAEELAAIRAELAEIKAGKAAPAPTAEPKLNDFESLEEFLQARDAWKDSQLEAKSRELEQQRKAEEVQTREQQAWAAFEATEQQYRDSLPDKGAEYDRASGRLSGMLIQEYGPKAMQSPLAHALRAAGPKVVYELAQNPETAAKLVRADPITVGIELGKIAAKVEDGGRFGRRHTQAPPAPQKVAGASGGVVKKFEDVMNDDRAYMEWRKAQGIT